MPYQPRTDANANVALTLSEYVANLCYEDLPPQVVQRAKMITLDTIGCMIMGSCMPLGPIIIQTVRDLGGVPESTVVTGGLKTSCVNATLANGTMVHGDELDEVGGDIGSGHPASINVPAALAVAERESANGKAYITALTSGYDILIRMARAFDVNNTLHLRSYDKAVIGGFASAAIAAKLLRLPIEKINNSLGLAGSTMSGLFAWIDEDQHMAKALVNGNSSASGVQAAILAQRGFMGPPAIFQGRFNAADALTEKDRYDLAVLTRELGSRFEILSTRIKKYSAGAPIHAPLDGLLGIMAEQGLQPQDLAEVIVWVRPRAAIIVNDNAMLNVNLQYILAVAAFDRKVELASHSQERAKDPKVWEMKKRIRLEHMPELDNEPWGAAVVEVKTTAGKTFSKRVIHPKGSLQNPLSQQEMEEKFFSLATMAISREHAQRILDTVLHLEDLGNLRELGDLVR
jgi:2-methylcitrate dehydratase PrpD